MSYIIFYVFLSFSRELREEFMNSCVDFISLLEVLTSFLLFLAMLIGFLTSLDKKILILFAKWRAQLYGTVYQTRDKLVKTSKSTTTGICAEGANNGAAKCPLGEIEEDLEELWEGSGRSQSS